MVPQPTSASRKLQDHSLRKGRSRTFSSQQRPPSNDLGHKNSRASPIREETHSFPHRANHGSLGETHSFPRWVNCGFLAETHSFPRNILGPPHYVWDHKLLHRVVKIRWYQLGIVDLCRCLRIWDYMSTEGAVGGHGAQFRSMVRVGTIESKAMMAESKD